MSHKELDIFEIIELLRSNKNQIQTIDVDSIVGSLEKFANVYFNTSKLLDALEKISKMQSQFQHYFDTEEYAYSGAAVDYLNEASDMAKYALENSKPRNCDRPTCDTIDNAWKTFEKERCGMVSNGYEDFGKWLFEKMKDEK